MECVTENVTIIQYNRMTIGLDIKVGYEIALCFCKLLFKDNKTLTVLSSSIERENSLTACNLYCFFFGKFMSPDHFLEYSSLQGIQILNIWIGVSVFITGLRGVCFIISSEINHGS